jgi:amidase
VVPIAHSQDTVGVHGRTLADAATVLGALVGVDPRDEATSASAGHFHVDCTEFLDADGLRGARIGVVRRGMTGNGRAADHVLEEAIAAMREAGATVVDPADIPTIDRIRRNSAEEIVLVYEFKRDLNAYLGTRGGVQVRTLAEVITFNEAHRDAELRWFGQEWLSLAESDRYGKRQYTAALARARRQGGRDGIDAALERHHLDGLIAPSGTPAWVTQLDGGDPRSGGSSGPAAMAGYPLISVPAGQHEGLPLGITFMGTAWSEPTLIRLASGFEAVTRARRKPGFLATSG